MHAAALGGSVKTLKLLMQHGGDLNVCDKEGRTPKHFAMFKMNPNGATTSARRRKILYFIEETHYASINAGSVNTTNASRPSRKEGQSSTAKSVKSVPNLHSPLPSLPFKPNAIIKRAKIPPPPPPMTSPLLPSHSTITTRQQAASQVVLPVAEEDQQISAAINDQSPQVQNITPFSYRH